MENGFKNKDILKCGNCGHHLYDHSFANPKALTREERKRGGIPWICINEGCGCEEFIPRQ